MTRPVYSTQARLLSATSVERPFGVGGVVRGDLDWFIDADASDEQRAMHAEYMALHWTAEFNRLAPCLGGHPARNPEVDAVPVTPCSLSPAEWSALFEARMWAEGNQQVPLTADEMRHLAAAISKLSNSAYEHRRKPIPCAGCGGAESVCNCACGYHPCGCTCHRAVSP